MADKKLSAKEKLFVAEYLKDLNATQAAIRAGYAVSMAEGKAQVWVGKSREACPKHKWHVWDAVQKRLEARIKKVNIDADYVLTQAVKLHERCMQEVTPLKIGGKEVLDDEGSKVYQFNAAGAAKALDLIGNHIGVQAYQKNSKVIVDDNRMSETERAERIDKILAKAEGKLQQETRH